MEKIMKGTVVDSKDKQPLVGANVFIEGSTVGTITDRYGNFKISNPENKDIETSYSGFKTQVWEGDVEDAIYVMEKVSKRKKKENIENRERKLIHQIYMNLAKLIQLKGYWD